MRTSVSLSIPKFLHKLLQACTSLIMLLPCEVPHCSLPFCVLLCTCLGSASWEHPTEGKSSRPPVNGAPALPVSRLYGFPLLGLPSGRLPRIQYWAQVLLQRKEWERACAPAPPPSLNACTCVYTAPPYQRERTGLKLLFSLESQKWQLCFYTLRYLVEFHSPCQVSDRGKSPDF